MKQLGLVRLAQCDYDDAVMFIEQIRHCVEEVVIRCQEHSPFFLCEGEDQFVRYTRLWGAADVQGSMTLFIDTVVAYYPVNAKA